MLKPNQTVVAKWGTKNKKRLVSLGYEFAHMGDAVLIKVEHLAYCSRVEVSYICDYCGEEVTTRYQTYNEGHKYCEKDACKKCAPLKSRDAFYEKYGVTNPLQVKEINEKQRKTCVKSYGYKVLRILGKSLPPEKQKLTNAIETLVNSNDDFMSINADL